MLIHFGGRSYGRCPLKCEAYTKSNQPRPVRPGGLFHARMPRKSRKTYTRSLDGCLMVEVSPGRYVEESIAERLGLLR